VKRWLSEDGWREMAPVSRRTSLDGLEDWIAERFRQHAGNAEVVRRELAAEKGIAVRLSHGGTGRGKSAAGAVRRSRSRLLRRHKAAGNGHVLQTNMPAENPARFRLRVADNGGSGASILALWVNCWKLG
jgi:hypothetical protein